MTDKERGKIYSRGFEVRCKDCGVPASLGGETVTKVAFRQKLIRVGWTGYDKKLICPP